MAETKNQDEPALHATKRNKPDASSKVDPLDYPRKTLKLDSSDNQTPIPESLDGKSSVGEAKDAEIKADADADENGEDDDEDYGADDEEEQEEGENGDVDRKGKGIMRDDKGKGKLIVEEEEEEEDDDDDDDDDSDNDDDSSDGGGSELDSDLSDDSLEEVDLDNILPSRTRRRQFQPPLPSGVHIGNDDGDSDA